MSLHIVAILVDLALAVHHRLGERACVALKGKLRVIRLDEVQFVLQNEMAKSCAQALAFVVLLRAR